MRAEMKHVPSTSVAVALTLLAGNGAAAQCPTYRVVDLGSLNTGAARTSEAFAINDNDQVVGQTNTDTPQAQHAFFWDATNCPGSNCMHDLGTLGGMDSIAHDINNGGEIVGQSEITIQALTVLRATYWASPTASPFNLGTLGIDAGDGSVAYGINENSTIVGKTDTEVFCPNDPQLDLLLGFRMPPTGGMTPLSPAGGFSANDNFVAAAFAINTPLPPPTPGLFPVIAGVGSPCGLSTPFCAAESSDSQAWDGLTPNDLPEPFGFGDGRGEALDVNDLEQLAGWGKQQGFPCRDRALFWPSIGSIPDNLHILAGIPANHETRAQGMNELGQVVGRNKSIDRAYLWTDDGVQWAVVNLHEEINASCQIEMGGPWEVEEARDINESGRIVGRGVYDGNTRAFLLIPIDTCLWDYTGPQGVPDGDVGIHDFLDLIGPSWGPCDPPNGICLADFDCDGTVAVTDELELLAHWGLCTEVCGGSGADGGGSGPSLAEVEEAIMQIGFVDMEEFSAWLDGATDAERALVVDVLAALLLD